MLKWLRNLITLFALLACTAGVAAAGPRGPGSPGGDGDPDGPMLTLPNADGGQSFPTRQSAQVDDGVAEVRAKQDRWAKVLRAYFRLSQWFSL
jgi:hypothetical protein